MGDGGQVHFGLFPLVQGDVAPGDSAFIEYGRDTTGADSLLFPGIRRIVSSPAAYNDGSWHYVTAVLSPQGQMLYVDGEQAAANPGVTSGQNYTGVWKLGNSISTHWEDGYTGRYFPGTIDEARVMYEEVSESWIKLCYETQKFNSTVVELGNSKF